jgi:hypothetical protein
MQHQPVLDSHGEPTGQYRFDAAGANRALELLGRHFAMFTDKVRVSEIEELTDEALGKRIEEKLRARASRAPSGT